MWGARALFGRSGALGDLVWWGGGPGQSCRRTVRDPGSQGSEATCRAPRKRRLHTRGWGWPGHPRPCGSDTWTVALGGPLIFP